jgi:YD repeat-containing protein
MLKNSIIILLTLFTYITYAQDTQTYQSDSVYRVNSVKVRRTYSGNDKKLMYTTYYDKSGFLTKYELTTFVDGAQRSTYYTYDLQGKLKNQVDTTINGEPDPKQIETLIKMGLDPNLFIKKEENKPPFEVSKYELIYQNDSLKKVKQYNPDGSLDLVDLTENNGKTKIRLSYDNDKLVRSGTIDYFTKYHYKRFYGWDTRSGVKREWNYTYKYKLDNNRIKSYKRYNYKKLEEAVKYFYNVQGLIVKITSKVPYEFDYDYY